MLGKVSRAGANECDRQGIDIVPRVMPGTWDRPDVDEANDRVSLQQVNEVGNGRCYGSSNCWDGCLGSS